jgi:hypothetical protein
MTEKSMPTYETYRGLPPLAGLCSMDHAIAANWSVEESVHRLKHLHYVLRRLVEIFTCRITAEPIYELKTAFSHHAYLCAEHVSAIRQRVGEMREPPLGLDKVPHPGLKLFCDEIQSAPSSESLVYGLYQVALPHVVERANLLIQDAHPLADAPTVRIAKFIVLEAQEMIAFGTKAIECLVDPTCRKAIEPWHQMLDACLHAVDYPIDSDQEQARLPEPHFSRKPYRFEPTPKRDERFQDSFNAGVNPEAFLYDEQFSPRDKTLMMFYKRLREIDVPEMMASILYELRDEEPWEFHMEMSRQLWDEARHAMMGEVGFASYGLDWRKIPINFTWSLNLNTQLTARERHGVLFFIEQGLMPKTGKRYEWEVGKESGNPLSALFQDFDWADEVLHAQIGRRWYVPRYKNLNEALAYGDRCWSKVLSHWTAYRDQGLTEHRNWWPELYRAACTVWQTSPDPRALAYNTTYETQRADLKEL